MFTILNKNTYTKSARPIRSSYVTVLASKQFDIRVGQEATTITVLTTRRFDIRVGQEATNYYYSKISCNLIIITAKTQLP